MSEEFKQGWITLLNARKAHYFVDHRSLCGNWQIFSMGAAEDHTHGSPDNCVKCMKLRVKREEFAKKRQVLKITARNLELNG